MRLAADAAPVYKAGHREAPLVPGPRTDVEAVSSVLAGIYEGLPRPDPDWDVSLHAIRHYLGADQATLIARPSRPQSSAHQVVICGDGQFSQYESLFKEHFHAIDPFVGLPNDVACCVEDLLYEDEWNGCAFNRNFLRRMNVSRVIGADFQMPGALIYSVRICRGEGAPRFSRTDKDRLDFLIPHLRRGIQSHIDQAETRATTQLFEATIDRLMVGAILLDADGFVIRTNRTASAVLKSGQAIKLHGNKLQAAVAADNSLLQRSIAKMAGPDCGVSGTASLSLSDPATGETIGIVVRRLAPDVLARPGQRAAIAVLFRDPHQIADISEKALRQIFSFTAAEGPAGFPPGAGRVAQRGGVTVGCEPQHGSDAVTRPVLQDRDDAAGRSGAGHAGKRRRPQLAVAGLSGFALFYAA